MNHEKRSRVVTVVSLLLCLSFIGACTARRPASSDPLTGRWRGTWGPSPSRQTEVTVELKWDGTTLQGIVNPGPTEIQIEKASFDSPTQTVQMELDGPNSQREIVRYVIQGKLNGTTMTGTFDRGGETGTFRIEKQ
jgi:hypothetical protein